MFRLNSNLWFSHQFGCSSCVVGPVQNWKCHTFVKADDNKSRRFVYLQTRTLVFPNSFHYLFCTDHSTNYIYITKNCELCISLITYWRLALKFWLSFGHILFSIVVNIKMRLKFKKVSVIKKTSMCNRKLCVKDGCTAKLYFALCILTNWICLLQSQ